MICKFSVKKSMFKVREREENMMCIVQPEKRYRQAGLSVRVVYAAAPSMVLYITMRLFNMIAVSCDINNKSYKQEK